jgi:cellulose synthase (UDP-forming)
MASYGIGQPILVGSHSAQRVAALAQVGGFAAHDADDLLVTLRYRARGWRGVYVPELLAMGLTPVGWAGYLQQQIRWSRGVIDLKLRELPRLMGQLPLVERLSGLFHGVFYLRSVMAPAIYLVVVMLLLTGATPAFLTGAALVRLTVYALALGAVSRFRYRYYLDPAREWAIPWRSFLLQLVKWPYQLAAVWRGLFPSNQGYLVTVKVPQGNRRRAVLWPHWGVATVMVTATLAAMARGGASWGTLPVAAMVIAVLSAAAGGFGVGMDPSPWEPDVYPERRAEMADVLAIEPPLVTKAAASAG